MIYEYECMIHNIFEVQQKLNDEPLIVCPQCEKEGKISSVKKIISSTSFILKGGGWAAQGYK